MNRRAFLGAALGGSVGVASSLRVVNPGVSERPARASAPAGEVRPATEQSTTGGDGSRTRASRSPLSDVTVGNRAITVSLPTDTEITQLSLVFDGTLVHRRRVWADQRAVSIDLYDVELDYSDATYRHAGYRPGTYTLVAYEDRNRVDSVDLHLVHGVEIEGVTIDPIHVDDGPAVPHLVYALPNPGSGPTYVHELFYRDARDATAVIENPDADRDLFAGADHEISVLPAARDHATPASPPIAAVPGAAEVRDPRFLAPGETRGYLGPPVGDTYEDSDEPSTLEMSPESLSPSVTVECVSGNVGPQDPSTTTRARDRFAALVADHLDAVTIVEYRLDLSVQGPTVTDEWGFYRAASVNGIERTGAWRSDELRT